MSDLIERQAAIDLAKDICIPTKDGSIYRHRCIDPDAIRELPSAQPEPAIPLQWIEAQIEWLKSLDNAFSTLTAGQISAMVNKWRDEQDE